MTNITARLKSLSEEKLIDIVKNYKQYGYAKEMRDSAIEILKDKGLDEEYLRLSGQFSNHNFDKVEKYYQSFKQNSLIALGLYCFILLSTQLLIYIAMGAGLGISLSIISVIAFLTYLIYLLRSFYIQDQFYKALGKERESEGAFSWFLLGMPFYLFMYFYFHKRMKEQMGLLT